MSHLIRRRTDADIEECVRLLADVHQRDGYPVNWPERPADWLQRASTLGAWVAETDGQLAGHVGLSTSRRGDLAPVLWSERQGVTGDLMAVDLTAVVSRMYVAAEARGHGLGERLIGQAVAESRLRGRHPVLDVVASNTAAVALYERLGWHKLGTLEQRWRDDQTVTIHCYAAP